VPIILLLFTNKYTSSLKEREIQAKFVELSVDILKESPMDTTKKNIRKWATKVISKYSGVELDASTTEDLIKNIPITTQLNANSLAISPETNRNLRKNNCSISSVISFDLTTNKPTVLTMEYNSSGNPINIYNNNVSTGSTNYKFGYNDKGQLKFTSSYYETPNKGFHFYSKYTYNTKNQIEKDTTYYTDFTSTYTIHLYTYDEKDRITKVEEYLQTGKFLGAKEYKYDSIGNLISDGLIYDNKKNPLTTNKIWQFLNRNYSLNNQSIASQYNEWGLPVFYIRKTTQPSYRVPGFFPEHPMHNVIYTCQ
ncbi:MAG: hypothetical protein SFU21_08375, partial [Flavihumibacter sp.]|nr:hypothetical protein [Flavihumibacter sp.]